MIRIRILRLKVSACMRKKAMGCFICFEGNGESAILMINSSNNELRYMINAAQYLVKEYDKQRQEMEWFARWDLAEEIGMEWIDAKGIILSENLAKVVSTEAIQILVEILNGFENEFENHSKKSVWTDDAMRTHPFWKKQRELAKQFLNIVGA